MKFAISGLMICLGLLLSSCEKPASAPGRVESVAVEFEGPGTLKKVLMDDKRGFAWVPLIGPRIQVTNEADVEKFMLSVWSDWNAQFPTKKILIASPVTEKGEVYGVTLQYSMR